MSRSSTSRASRRCANISTIAGPPAAPPLTFLPFIVAALARVLDKFPQCNALYDTARGVLVKHKAVHVGIATQTPQGLKVPVVRNAESRALHDLAAEIRRVVRSRAQQQVAARGAHRLHDHGHQPRASSAASPRRR